MDVEPGRHFLVELGQELLELHRPVVPVQGTDHLAGGDLQSGEQGGGAGADVVMASTLGDAGHHRQDRLGPVERLDL